MSKPREELHKSHRADLKEEIQKGITELEQGEVVEFDINSFIARMHSQPSHRIARSAGTEAGITID